MITSVHLTNWRAYGDVTLQLEPGTTFLVAANGVGKSSMIEAVKWALDRSAKPTPDPIRKGQRLAAVELELDISGNVHRVRRSLDLGNATAPRKTPKDSYETWIGSEPCGTDDFFDHLAAVWGADAGFVARTAFLTDDLISGEDEPELRTHLCRAFALDHLQKAAQELGPIIAAAEKEADAARKSEHGTEAELARAELDVAQATAELEAAEALTIRLRAAADAASNELAAAEAAADERRRLHEWEVERDAIVRLASELTGPIQTTTPLLTVLQAASSAASRQLDQAKEDRARLTERLRTSNEALERLLSAAGECPVCRRPLDDSSRSAAQAKHEHDQTDTTTELDGVDVSASASIAEQLRILTQRAERLGEPPSVTTSEITDIAAARESARLAKAEFETSLAHEGEARARRTAAASARDSIKSRLETASNVPQLYRKQGVLEAAREALEATIEEVLRQQLGPISRELNLRWDAIFSDRPGLQVNADGRISRHLDQEVLDFKSFSSGEKTVAQLLFRLATLVTTSKVPFCWIDEPLEHLDPASRMVVARTLAFLTKQNYLGQIIVTTYEVDLANKLGHSDRDHVRLEYLGTSQVRS